MTGSKKKFRCNVCSYIVAVAQTVELKKKNGFSNANVMGLIPSECIIKWIDDTCRVIHHINI